MSEVTITQDGPYPIFYTVLVELSPEAAAKQYAEEAEASASAAAASATSAGESATAAAASASAAATSEGEAAASETAAATSESNAAGSATAAANSAMAAANSATAAAASETAAEAAKDAVEGITDFTAGNIYRGDGTGIAAVNETSFLQALTPHLKSPSAFYPIPNLLAWDNYQRPDITPLTGNTDNGVSYTQFLTTASSDPMQADVKLENNGIEGTVNGTWGASQIGVPESETGYIVKSFLSAGGGFGQRGFIIGYSSSTYYLVKINRSSARIDRVIDDVSTEIYSKSFNISFGRTRAGSILTVDFSVLRLTAPPQILVQLRIPEMQVDFSSESSENSFILDFPTMQVVCLAANGNENQSIYTVRVFKHN